MFERYTERARRVLFFARYEASQMGSRNIAPAHLLLGLIREGEEITRQLFQRARVEMEAVKSEIESRSEIQEKISTSVEIPLSPETKKVLHYAAEEAEAAHLRLKEMGEASNDPALRPRSGDPERACVDRLQ